MIMMIKRVTEMAVKDFEWIDQHYSELMTKYPNMYIAVREGRILAAHKEFGKVYDEATKKAGKDFVTEYIFSGEPIVLEVDVQNC